MMKNLSKSTPESRSAARSGSESSRRTVARWAAYLGVIFPLVIGLVVLAGWFFELPQLTTIVPGFSSMKPNTAAGFLLAALSLALQLRETKQRIVFGKSLALLVLALGVLTAAEYVFDYDFRIDSLLVGVSASESSNPFPARMSPYAAFCFLSTGVGLWFLTGRKIAKAIADFAALAAMMTALLGLMGYAYGMSALYRIGPFTPTSIHTDLAFLVLGCGMLAARPERGLVSILSRGTSGSVLARRLLPAALVLPLVLGWLRVRGEQAGYFELPMGTALLAASLMVFFVALIWRTAVSLDRTDLARQRTENALRESEAAKAAILASALDCIIAMDRQGRVIEWNPAAEKTFGYLRVDAVGKPLADLIIPERFRESHWRGLTRFLEIGEGPLLGKRIEMPALHSDGSEFPVELSIVVSRGDDLFFTAYLRDITERKRAETARQRLAAIVESSEDAIISKDLNGIIITWNTGAERLLGYRAEEAIGQPVTILIPPDHGDEEPRILASIGRGETFKNFATVRRRKDGTLIEVSVTISPIKADDGRITGASKIMHDITARKRAERELAEKARLLDLSHDAIIARNLDGNITVWNRGAEEYYGWKAEDVVGKHLDTLLQTKLPKPMPEILEELYREKSFAAEVVQTARNGQRIPLFCRWALDQEQGSILTSCTDITERLQTEKWLAERARLLDLTNDAVVVRDTTDRITFWNQGAENLFGWTSQEVLGKDLQSLLHTEYPKPEVEIKAELHREGKLTGEVVQVARDGQRIPSLCRWVLDRKTASILTSYTDMSAIKRAEEALRASENKYRTLFEAMDQGYCIIEVLFDADGKANDWRFLDVNAAFERHHGVSGALGNRMRELVPDIEPKWFEIYGKVALTGEAIRFVEHSTALHRWFDLYAYRVDGGGSRNVAILFADITQRKEAENALHESEERMRLATEATGVGIWEWNVLRGYIRWDAEMFRIYGLAPTSDGMVPYSAWSEAVVAEDLEQQEAILKETVRQRGHSAREFRIKRQDTQEERRIKSVETVRLDSQEQVEWVVGTNLDITERRKAEEALRESEDNFRALGENIAQLAWMADAQGSIFWYNKRWYDYTGTTFEEMQGWGWEKIHEPGELQRILPGWKHALATGEPWEDIFPLRQKDGHYGWFLSRAFPLRDGSGKITRWFGTNTDITELRETQEELKRAREDLQRHAASLEVTVNERTVKLHEMIGELEAFSYSLSHDMRAPLRAIQGFTQLALEECGEKAGPFLGKVISAAVRLDRMIQEVLSYTRISHQEIRSERIDVDRLVHNIIAERSELQPPRAEVIVKTPLLAMRGHEASLTQCLTNLLGNAVKFVPRDVLPQVVVSSELRDDDVRLWIEDNGIGIEPEAQHKLFEMFYRLNSDKEYEGTGIGLAIVRKAVERMGGTVGLESEAGRGSRFWVQLPKGETE